MKRFLFVCMGLFLMGVSAQARLTRLMHVRGESLSAISTSASAMSMAVGQPMLGMMAMGGMQQAAQQLFGSVDQNKPVYMVAYMKGDLPDMGGLDLQNNPAALAAWATNLVVSVMMPATVDPDAFLKAKGATDTTDGVYKESDEQWWACREGYAFFSNNPESLGEAVQEMRRGLDARLPDMAAEVVIDTPALAAYTDLIMAMMGQMETPPAEAAAFGEFGPLLIAHQKAQAEAVAHMMKQFDRMAMGMNYDLNGGLFCEFLLEVAPDSEFAQAIDRAETVPLEALGAIPPGSPFFIAMGGCQDMMGEMEQLVANLREQFPPKIDDAAVREQVARAMDDMIWMTDNLRRVVAFADWDADGRLAMISQTRTTDNARYLAAGRSISLGMLAVLNHYAPNQRFLTFDPEAMSGTLSVEALIDFISEQVGEAPDSETREQVLRVADVIMGRTFAFSAELRGDEILEKGSAQGSTYAPPAANDSPVAAARIRALLPESFSGEPLQAGFLSIGGMIRHLAPRVMQALDVKNEAVDGVITQLADVDAGGTQMVSWTDNGTLRQKMNVSAAEFKGLVSFFSSIGTAATQPQMMPETADADETLPADDAGAGEPDEE